MKKSLIQCFILIFFVLHCKNSVETKTFNAMAPLHIMHYLNPKLEQQEDWELFREQLSECQSLGIDAITVDVWWGLVEKKADNNFDWEYYHKIFYEIMAQNLEIIPILSFHSYDPGSESEFRAPIPNWVWKYLAQKSGFNSIDLKYVSEDLGIDGSLLYSNEFVSLWVDEWVMPQYIEFMEEFLDEFQSYLKYFQEINISCGPSGELRYPSYGSHDAGSYPNRGRMQCFSKPAIQNYKQWLNNKRNGRVAKDLSPVSRKDLKIAIENEDYLNRNMRDFFQWYNQSLMEHGNRMLRACLNIFPESIPIGFKIPGIHWRIADPKMPRISELTCGLIDGSTMNGVLAYDRSLSIVLRELPLERIILHFTCLEQDNAPSDVVSHDYSKARDLVFDMSSVANRLGINIKGENALSKNLKDQSSWKRIRSALENGSYTGITILRMNDVTTANPLGKREYKKIIDRFRL